jgi:hypothetical protein
LRSKCTRQGDASKFEGRIEGLLSAFRRLRLPPEIAGRFHLMGGECNYLLRVDPSTCRLEFVPDEVRAHVKFACVRVCACAGVRVCACVHVQVCVCIWTSVDCLGALCWDGYGGEGGWQVGHVWDGCVVCTCLCGAAWTCVCVCVCVRTFVRAFMQSVDMTAIRRSTHLKQLLHSL